MNSRSCNCGLGAGGDVCSGGGLGSVSGVINGGSSSSGDACQPLVVRPQTLPTIDLNSYSKPRVVCKTVGSSVHTLKPIGGLCTCGKTIIKPAVIPKPNCAACAEGGTVSISGSGSSSSASEVWVADFVPWCIFNFFFLVRVRIRITTTTTTRSPGRQLTSRISNFRRADCPCFRRPLQWPKHLRMPFL